MSKQWTDILAQEVQKTTTNSKKSNMLSELSRRENSRLIASFGPLDNELDNTSHLIQIADTERVPAVQETVDVISYRWPLYPTA